MTEKQERFIDEYIIDFNATRAAIAAGYSSKRANSQGVHLLSIPEIQAEVRRRKAEISAGLRISAERVLWEMAALGFSNIFDYVEVIDGELRLKELPPEKQGAVSSIKITKNGTEVKLHDKLKALEFLAKYTGLIIPIQSTMSGQIGRFRRILQPWTSMRSPTPWRRSAASTTAP